MIKQCFADIRLVMGFFTRIPVYGNHSANDNRTLAQAAWAFPLPGLVVGAACGGIFAAGLTLGFTPLIAALLALSAQTLLTGALHEDGLADTVDGFAGGKTRQERLAIMKDSRIGTFGVLALLFSLGLRVACIAALADAQVVLLAWIFIAMGSRSFMVVIMGALPPARADGLAVLAQTPSRTGISMALFLAVLAGFALLGTHASTPLAAAALATTFVLLWAKRRIGGMTGDVCGAAQQLSEMAMWLALAAAL